MSMTPTLATLVAHGKKAAAGAGALATAAALGATLLAAAPAQASPTPAAPAMAAPAKPYGTVVTHGDVLLERQYPSKDSSKRGSLNNGAQIGLRCKVRAQNIEGNTIWYLLRDRATWVSAKYVNNTGDVKYCNEVLRSKAVHVPAGKHLVG
ncbi:SH3 domain-containing protein [Streptomyces sp. NPDC050610]|uniref:SH3 domain-containing protein n=1 Tax=Streptomyces sp. NPDC050610 TaxID=3157097 RepID=UPI003436FDCB